MALSADAMEKYDIVRQLQEASKPDLNELGSAGNAKGWWSGVGVEDYNPALRGWMGRSTYDKMRRGDAQIRATLRLIKAPFLAGQWYMQAASEDEYDKMINRFVEWNMKSMSRTWLQFISEALLCFDFGFSVFEKVFEESRWRDTEVKGAKPRDVIKWQKFGPRHPLLLDRWEFDAHGGLDGMWHSKPDGSSVWIPISKLLLFTMDEEANNPEGMSLLRSAYKHWWYKENMYKIDGIQKERHGIGVPNIGLPIGYSDSDKRYARELGRNMRTNDQAYIVRLPGWEVGFAELNTQLANALESAEHHDTLIARNVLGQFLNIGTSEVGSRASVSASQSLFVKSLRFIGDLFCGIINQYGIRQLVDYNFKDVERYPELRVRRLGDTSDWRAIAVTIRNLVESKIITPSPELEEWLMDQMEFPRPPKAALDKTVKDREEVKLPAVAPPHE